MYEYDESMEGWIEDERLSKDSAAKYGWLNRRLSETIQLSMGYSLKIEDCPKIVQLSMDGWIEDGRLSEDSTAKYGWLDK